MSNKEESADKKLSSVKYYILKNENAVDFYNEWKFKTMAIIWKNGWSNPFDDPTMKIPTKTKATGSSATESKKHLYKSNLEAYDQILMGCSGVLLGLVGVAGDARKAINNLDKKYARKGKSQLTKTLLEFQQCKLESKSVDPDEWFVKLDKINERLDVIGTNYQRRTTNLKPTY